MVPELDQRARWALRVARTEAAVVLSFDVALLGGLASIVILVIARAVNVLGAGS